MGYFISEDDQSVVSPPTHERFESNRGLLKLGFQTGTVWIRVGLDSLGQSNWREELNVLRVRSYYLTEVDLYELVAGQWRRTAAGGGGPGVSGVKENPCYDGQHCFRVNQNASDEVYLRIRASTVMNIGVDLIDLQKAMSDSSLRLSSLTMHATIAACILFAAILFAVFERSALSLSFFFLQLAVLITHTGTNGLLVKWVPLIGSPDAWNSLIHFALIGRVAALAALIHAVFTHYKPRVFVLNSLKIVFLVHVVLGLITLSGHSAVVSAISLAMLFVILSLAALGLMTTKGIPPAIKRLAVVGLTVTAVLLVLACFSMTNFGLAEGLDVHLDGLADRKFSGLGVGLFVLWFALTESARKKREATDHTNELRFSLRISREREAVTKERGLLIDMLTHEINNPLGTIRFASAALQSKVIESVPQEVDQRYYYRLTSSIRRIEALLHQVTLHNRLHHTDTGWERCPLNVGELLSEIKDGLDDAERLELHVPDGFVRPLNKQLFLIAMENLILNAQKYGDPESVIKVQVSPSQVNSDSGRVCGWPPPSTGFEVSISNRLLPGSYPDTGAIFKPYYRHESATHHAGMGLGLSLVKTAIEKLGGVIEAQIKGDTICFQIHIA